MLESLVRLFEEYVLSKDGAMMYLCNGVEVFKNERRVSHADAQHGAAVWGQQLDELLQELRQGCAQVPPICACVLAAQPNLPHLLRAGSHRISDFQDMFLGLPTA